MLICLLIKQHLISWLFLLSGKNWVWSQVISVFISARFEGLKPLNPVSTWSICKARQTHLKFRVNLGITLLQKPKLVCLGFSATQTEKNVPKLKIWDAHPKQGSSETTRSAHKEDFLIKSYTQPPQMLHFRACRESPLGGPGFPKQGLLCTSGAIFNHSRAEQSRAAPPWGLWHWWHPGDTGIPFKLQMCSQINHKKHQAPCPEASNRFSSLL